VYRPGVSQGAEAIADALFGEIPIQGKLPIQLPRSLGEITEQREDLPFDLDTPLYDFGFGLEVSSFGRDN
jgi:beta-glucosidase